MLDNGNRIRAAPFKITTVRRVNSVHYFLGLSWDEWASIVAILSSFVFSMGWLFKRIISSMLEPIYIQLKELSKDFKQLSRDFEKREQSISNLDRRIDVIESRLAKQETNIKNLNREVFEHEDKF